MRKAIIGILAFTMLVSTVGCKSTQIKEVKQDTDVIVEVQRDEPEEPVVHEEIEYLSEVILSSKYDSMIGKLESSSEATENGDYIITLSDVGDKKTTETVKLTDKTILLAEYSEGDRVIIIFEENSPQHAVVVSKFDGRSSIALDTFNDEMLSSSHQLKLNLDGVDVEYAEGVEPSESLVGRTLLVTYDTATVSLPSIAIPLKLIVIK